ncbi:hypothetical protein [Victivallis vadensis]|jgi:hypothetical protein|uniref:Uncharacterized protein n=1 Tax=Victivallis vadensis TaxID=172901 RepID=A0A848B1Z3_9BACT|nr:hypothetical protein [Victivallis vadensis]NMD87760.1 hypothetical protein [Victivallis vadensis]HJH04038.1 hypothetical protein [Victivallis vadensis]
MKPTAAADGKKLFIFKNFRCMLKRGAARKKIFCGSAAFKTEKYIYIKIAQF